MTNVVPLAPPRAGQVEKRKTKRTPLPRINVAGQASVELSEADFERLTAATGCDSQDAITGLLGDISALCNVKTDDGRAIDEQKLNRAIDLVAGISPRDPLEMMIATQIAAVHLATMKSASGLMNTTKPEMAEVHEKALNRLARTFAAQTEALKRLRSKGEQRIYVERVNVSEGGQAIVGNVGRGLGGEGDV